MGMLGARTLLVNPPLIGGIAFTRQGRCQEREEVLGTTKPPYTLALVAAMLRDRGCDVRLADLTATRQSVEDLIARLDREQFRPTLIVFPSTRPDDRCRRRGDGEAQGALRRAAVLVRPACVLHAERGDGTGAGRGRHVRRRAGRRPDCTGGADLAATRSTPFRASPSGATAQIVPHQAQGSFTGFLTAPTRPGTCSTCRSTGCRSSTSRTSWSRARGAARTRAISAWRRFTRATSSAKRARRSWSTKWSAATATSA